MSEELRVKSDEFARARAFVDARYSFTLVERRVVYVVMDEVRRRFLGRGDGEFDVSRDCELRIDTVCLGRIRTELDEVCRALEGLSEKPVFIAYGGAVLEARFVSRFEHRARARYVDVVVSGAVLPYVAAFASYFTVWRLAVAVSLKSKHSQRLYEYCSLSGAGAGVKGGDCFWDFCVGVGELRYRMMLDLGDRYSKYALLKKQALCVAQEELKGLYDAGLCDLYFECKEEKVGKRVESLRFCVYGRGMGAVKVESLGFIDRVTCIRLWLEDWLTVYKRPEYLEWVAVMVMPRLRCCPDLAVGLHGELAELKRKRLSRKGRADIARYIVGEHLMLD